MNRKGKQILAAGLAALLAAGTIALIGYAFSTGFISISAPSNRDLIDTPLARNNPAANSKPPAFEVQLAVIPGAAKLPNPSSVGPAATRIPAAPAPQLARLPQAIELSQPQAPAFPEPVDMPTAHSDLDFALHPSLKYAHWTPSATVARPTNAAFNVPLAVYGQKTAALAASLKSSAKPATAVVDDDAQTRELIDANLKMEEDRKFVMSMCEDLRGCLWVGTEGGGIQRFDPSATELHQWTEFTTKDGLGDDNGYALACDRQDRIWVGHLNHGVSVFNHNSQGHWQCYEEVGGLSRPGTLNGPLGERVFAIKVCPSDGDVWIATNCGLSRYSEKLDTWSYHTRADGLPFDEASAISFDNTGNIYVGTQCDGIAMADAADGYGSWRTVTGPDQEPSVPNGDGLPSNLINDVLVAPDGTIYAATDAGLAWSKDSGSHWSFIRGADWADKVKGRIGGAPKAWQQRSATTLQQDYCTCLAEDGDSILIGHWDARCERFDSNTPSGPLGVRCYARAFASVHGQISLGSYGGGALQVAPSADGLVSRPAFEQSESSPASFPRQALPPTPQQLVALVAGIKDIPPSTEPKVVALPDDWKTQGSWMGRYGRYTGIFAAMSNPGDYVWGAGEEPANYAVRIGPAFSDRDSVRYYRTWLYTTNPSSLEIPPVYLESRIARGLTTLQVNRRESEWDDHGEVYPTSLEGPDIYCTIRVPAGTFWLSLYDFNKDGHTGANDLRDYEVNIWEHPSGTALSDLSSVGLGQPLAHSRIKDFWGGVYKSFAVRGPIELTVQARRNHSHNTILAGAFLDTLEEKPAPYFPAAPDLATPSINGSDSGTSDDALLSQLQNRAAGSLANLAQDRSCYAMLLRHLLAEQGLEQIPKRSPDLGTCYFALNEFGRWEDCQRKQGLIPARAIEKALRWDRRIPTYSGRGHQTVVDYLQNKVAPPAGRPPQATPQ